MWCGHPLTGDDGEADVTPRGSHLHAIGALSRLSFGGAFEQRRTELSRLREAMEIEDLWTFAVVEDDLFLRDCIGAVPGDDEIAAVVAALGAGSENAVEVNTPSRVLVIVPATVATGLVVTAAFNHDAGTSPVTFELLECLREALLAGELSGDRVGDDGEPMPGSVEDRLERLAADRIRHAMVQAGGDGGRAAEYLGVSSAELARWRKRLDLG